MVTSVYRRNIIVFPVDKYQYSLGACYVLGTVQVLGIETFVKIHSHHSTEVYILMRKAGNQQINKMSDSIKAG